MEWKRNEKGMRKNTRNQVEIKLIGIEWNWNENGMETFHQK